MQHSDLVYVKRVKGKGRGVFARRPIAAGTVIEHVPVVLVPVEQLVGGWGNPFFSRFCFARGRATVALALGYGSLYNHSYKPNAVYEEGTAATMLFRALRDIAAGEEITVNYNGDPRDRAPVGFTVV
jgi:SET domain-containing protein